MHLMFVNFKRFDVPKTRGGLCPYDNASLWIRDVIQESAELGLGSDPEVSICYILPESLLYPALQALDSIGRSDLPYLEIGCQGVYRENVEKGGNFGAFTTFLPAAAAVSVGCTWAMVGHSEERKGMFDLLCEYHRDIRTDAAAMGDAEKCIHRIMNQEARRALESGMNVLFCLGETQEQRGEGTFEQQKQRLETVFTQQVELGLAGLAEFTKTGDLVIGYEPRWAIGPGKIPPSTEYIGFVSDVIKRNAEELYGIPVDVVYGGGLKRENAAGISAIGTVNGGLVALTKFTQPIGFSPLEFKTIIDLYCGRGIEA